MLAALARLSEVRPGVHRPRLPTREALRNGWFGDVLRSAVPALSTLFGLVSRAVVAASASRTAPSAGVASFVLEAVSFRAGVIVLVCSSGF